MAYDHPLGDVTPDQPGDHTPHQHDDVHDPGAHPLAEPVQYLTVADVLAAARLPERTASICLRADLTAEHDHIMGELATLVTPGGELLDDDVEGSRGDETNASRAQALVDRDRQVLAEMRGSMWHVRFRGMDAEVWTSFKKAHLPKSKDGDFTAFHTKIIATCAIEPAMTEEDVVQLRKKFNESQFLTLANKAYAACSEGGIDVPKSPTSSVRLPQQ